MPNETFLGRPDEILFIAEYLANLRMLIPSEMFPRGNATSLSDARVEGRVDVDFDFFDEMLTAAQAYMRSNISDRIEFVPLSRYFICQPDEDELGGFHGKYSVGHHTMWGAACVSVLNAQKVIDKRVRTVEFFRSFLHDAVHQSTFCAYRLNRLKPVESEDSKNLLPQVHREQYGINFRNAGGISYSDRKLTAMVPYAINLNLLMDGVGVLVIADVLRRIDVEKELHELNDREKSILDEMLIRVDQKGPSQWGRGFYFGVTLPTQRSIEYWGGDEFQRLVFNSMLSGDLTELKTAFEAKHGEPNAWERVFKRPDFVL